jgi:hypothetical protein
MQMALEALDSDNPDIQLRAAIALRQALETEQEPVAWMHNFIEGNVITHIPADIGRHPERWTPLYTSPPKREWVPEALRLADALDDEFTQGRISNHNGRKAAVELRRLALKQWVGLTDEEIAQGLKESWVTEQAWQSAVWWAEAKLKEKNKW